MNRLISILTAALLIGTVAWAADQPSKIGPRLLQRLQSSAFSGFTKIPVIVEFVDKADLTRVKGHKKVRREKIIRKLKAKAENSKATLQDLLVRHGLVNVEFLWLLNGLSFEASPSLINQMAALPSVAQIRLDYQITPPATGAGSASPAEWNLTQIGAPGLWDRGITGQSIVVANMDTGVDINHSELAATWRGGSNSWYDPYCQPAPWENPVFFVPAASCPPNADYSIPRDGAGMSSGHGSGTMGIMVGGDGGGSAIGVAPDAQWIAVKIFDENGIASMTGIHKGFQWLLDPDNDPATDDAPDIVNNSWVLGGTDVDGCILEFQPDLQVLKAAGIAVVFAAGNEGGSGNSNTSVSPSNNPEGYAVGAVDQFEQLALWSSRGPRPTGTVCAGGFYPELVAPGVAVRTADRSLIPGMDSYQIISGSSFAAPHVAGAMALLLDVLPNLTPADLETALLDSARETMSLDDPAGPDDAYGYGVLDVAEAYNLLCPVGAADADGDGIPDVCDNCTLLVNADQRDTDRDGYGNLCDCDLNNDGNTDYLDLGKFSSVFFTSDPNADFNGDGFVDYLDLGLFSAGFFQPPGPSGQVQ